MNNNLIKKIKNESEENLAIYYDGTQEALDAITELVEKTEMCWMFFYNDDNCITIVKKFHSNVSVDVNNYLIKNIKHDVFYTCEPDIFKQTYHIIND